MTVDQDLLRDVIRNAMFAADTAVLNGTHATGAERTRAAVTAAFEMAAGNGLIRCVPADEWPEWLALDPPYEPGFPKPAKPEGVTR